MVTGTQTMTLIKILGRPMEEYYDELRGNINEHVSNSSKILNENPGD